MFGVAIKGKNAKKFYQVLTYAPSFNECVFLQVKELRGVISSEDHRDDDLVRDFYLAQIRSAALTCLEEISSFKTERQVLAHMAKVRAGKAPPPSADQPKRRPMKPIIITKDKVNP